MLGAPPRAPSFENDSYSDASTCRRRRLIAYVGYRVLDLGSWGWTSSRPCEVARGAVDDL